MVINIVLFLILFEKIGYIRSNLNENLLCENLKKDVPGDMNKYWKCYENAVLYY